MTALPDAKREALRFRIWQFCQPREWDVTSKEIAEALEISWPRVVLALRNAGWTRRVRVLVTRDGADVGPATGGHISSERFIVRDVLAGRVEAGTL